MEIFNHLRNIYGNYVYVDIQNIKTKLADKTNNNHLVLDYRGQVNPKQLSFNLEVILDNGSHFLCGSEVLDYWQGEAKNREIEVLLTEQNSDIINLTLLAPYCREDEVIDKFKTYITRQITKPSNFHFQGGGLFVNESAELNCWFYEGFSRKGKFTDVISRTFKLYDVLSIIKCDPTNTKLLKDGHFI